MTAESEIKFTSQLWAKNAERIQLVESILREWEKEDLDVIIAPGFAYPAVPLGIPAKLFASIKFVSYTVVYNMLDFPAGSVKVCGKNKWKKIF